VLSVEPSTEEQIAIIADLSKEDGIDFWSFRPAAFQKSVFAVSPDLLADVSEVLRRAEIEAQVLIPDLQVQVFGISVLCDLHNLALKWPLLW